MKQSVPLGLRLAASLLPREVREEVLGDLLEKWTWIESTQAGPGRFLLGLATTCGGVACPYPRKLPRTCHRREINNLGKPEERGATEKEARNVLGPKGPEILEFLRDELAKCLPDDEDRDAILSGLVRAVVTEEVTRQTITKQPMIPGLASDVDKGASDLAVEVSSGTLQGIEAGTALERRSRTA